MTTVKLNHEGVDVVEIKASTSASNNIHFTAKDNLFNADLNYIFAVTDLNVDCSNLPIFHPSTAEPVFAIRKRQNNFPLADHSPEMNIAVAGRKYYDTSTFMSDVSAVAFTFSKEQDANGLGLIPANHYKTLAGGPFFYLKIGFDACGRIMIEGVSEFWNHFVLEFSHFSVKLFQLEDVVDDNNILSLTMLPDPNGIDTVQTAQLFDAVGNINPGNILTLETVIGKGSVLKFCDQRLFLTVETHLPIQRNIRVHNSKEQTDPSILRVPFNNNANSTIYCKNGIIVDDISLTTRSYVGRVNFAKKTQPIQQWNTLTSSFEQKIFRFQLYCIYNRFAGGSFAQTKIAVPFTELGEWDLSLRFVSKI